MTRHLKGFLQPATTAALLTILPAVSTYAAESHVVSLTEIQQKAVAASQERKQNLAELDRFFSSGSATAALKVANVDGTQVRQAAAMLNDEELNRLAGQARKARTDFAAGSLNNQQITYILIALATAVVVLIIVEH